MGLYPAMDDVAQTLETVDGFRLRQISDIKRQLERERDVLLRLYKKYHWAVDAIDGVDTALVVAGMGLGGAGIGLLSTIMATPVVLGLEVAAGVSRLAGTTLKLNTTDDRVSSSLTDSKISEEEFRLILAELIMYRRMKEEIRTKTRKTADFSEDEKKKLIEQGRQQIIQAFLSKNKDLVKDAR